ncbi:SIT4 phosphatase-associated protein-domain-containing protein [Flagelloscypha sp. PMI_526]|nr:SIT4 phosphatase-associated protein-domain-containing protein [Flagelloscypha sp. PMI_526]
MFWKFGFANASSIDSLLDKDDVSLEAILDQDDLLQECKAQNTRLINYLQRADVLQRLFGYVTRTIETREEIGVFKYPNVATEVLCSEIWSIVETSLNEHSVVLLPFWETVLDRTAEDMKTEMILAGHFVKITTTFMTKKPDEMFAFIQSQEGIVDKLLVHIESPAIVDLLVRIIQLDEPLTERGSIQWLSSQDLIPKLLEMLAPSYTSDIHVVVADLLKTIISLATPSTTPAGGGNEGLPPPSNLFSRELARRSSVERLMDYILADFGPNHNVRTEYDGDDSDLPTLADATSSVVQSISIIIELIRKNNSDFFEPYLFHLLRHRLLQVQQESALRSQEDERKDMEAAMEEMTQRIAIVHLGPMLQLMVDAIPKLKTYLRVPRSLKGLVKTTIGPITPLTFERFRIVELLAELMHCSNMSLLNRPPSTLYDAQTGVLRGGLGSLDTLARVISTNGMTSGEIGIGGGMLGEDEDSDEDGDGLEPALELPISGKRPLRRSSEDEEDVSISSDGSDDDDDATMEEIVMQHSSDDLERMTPPPESPHSPADSPMSISSPIQIPDLPVPLPLPTSVSPSFATPPGRIGSPVPFFTGSPASVSPSSSVSALPRKRTRSSGSKRSTTSKRRSILASSSVATLNGSVSGLRESVTPSEPVGEQLKKVLMDAGILQTLLDLFFVYPWNNFLHISVYDVLHQILTGSVEKGCWNRELAISLFREGKLMSRIVEGQRKNDAEVAQPKGVRLGYMGHLTLISEDVLMVLNDRFPPDLVSLILDSQTEQEKADWDAFVNGGLDEARKRDERLLGGGKPVIGSGFRSGASGAGGGIDKWKVDEADVGSGGTPLETISESPGEIKGSFRRSATGRPSREGSADFGVAMVEEEEEVGDLDEDEEERRRQLSRYLGSTNSRAADDDYDSDEEDDTHSGWLAQSNLSPNTSTSSAPKRPLGDGFDDMFNSSSGSKQMMHDPFADDDDAFGAFAESSTLSSTNTDPFGMSKSSSSPSSSSGSGSGSGSSSSFDEMMFDDSGFDFGDFQTAEGAVDVNIIEVDVEEKEEDDDGQLTPTAGSWTFDDDFGFGPPGEKGTEVVEKDKEALNLG